MHTNAPAGGTPQWAYPNGFAGHPAAAAVVQGSTPQARHQGPSQAPMAGASVASGSCNILVAGLGFEANDVALRKLFEPFGEVVSAMVMYDTTSGRSRGFGFVQYEHAHEAAMAVEKMHRQRYGGLVLNVTLSHHFGQGTPTTALFLRNIPVVISPESIEVLCSQFGKVVSVRFASCAVDLKQPCTSLVVKQSHRPVVLPTTAPAYKTPPNSIQAALKCINTGSPSPSAETLVPSSANGLLGGPESDTILVTEPVTSSNVKSEGTTLDAPCPSGLSTNTLPVPVSDMSLLSSAQLVAPPPRSAPASGVPTPTANATSLVPLSALTRAVVVTFASEAETTKALRGLHGKQELLVPIVRRRVFLPAASNTSDKSKSPTSVSGSTSTSKTDLIRSPSGLSSGPNSAGKFGAIGDATKKATPFTEVIEDIRSLDDDATTGIGSTAFTLDVDFRALTGAEDALLDNMSWEPAVTAVAPIVWVEPGEPGSKLQLLDVPPAESQVNLLGPHPNLYVETDLSPDFMGAKDDPLSTPATMRSNVVLDPTSRQGRDQGIAPESSMVLIVKEELFMGGRRKKRKDKNSPSATASETTSESTEAPRLSRVEIEVDMEFAKKHPNVVMPDDRGIPCTKLVLGAPLLVKYDETLVSRRCRQRAVGQARPAGPSTQPHGQPQSQFGNHPALNVSTGTSVPGAPNVASNRPHMDPTGAWGGGWNQAAANHQQQLPPPFFTPSATPQFQQPRRNEFTQQYHTLPGYNHNGAATGTTAPAGFSVQQLPVYSTQPQFMQQSAQPQPQLMPQSLSPQQQQQVLMVMMPALQQQQQQQQQQQLLQNQQQLVYSQLPAGQYGATTTFTPSQQIHVAPMYPPPPQVVNGRW